MCLLQRHQSYRLEQKLVKVFLVTFEPFKITLALFATVAAELLVCNALPRQ